MSDELAQIVKDDFAFFHTDMRELGEVKSVKFTGVNPSGLDDYEVRTATATNALRYIWVQTARLFAAGFYPTVPLRSQP